MLVTLGSFRCGTNVQKKKRELTNDRVSGAEIKNEVPFALSLSFFPIFSANHSGVPNAVARYGAIEI